MDQTAPSQPLPPPAQAPLPRRVAGTLLRAVWSYLFFLLLLLTMWMLKDTFYPFSHYPMYSHLSTKAYYAYLTDGEDEPVPAFGLFALRTSHLSKILRSNLNKVAKEAGVDRKQATDAHYEEAGRRSLQQLLAQGIRPDAKVPLPPELRLYYVEIYREGSEPLERVRFCGSIPTSGAAISNAAADNQGDNGEAGGDD